MTAYRMDCAVTLRIVSRASVPLDGAADAEFDVFRGGEGLRDQTAIIIGKPDFAEAVAVRLHSAYLTGDLFGSLKCDCGDQLRHAARYFAENGGGVLLYLDQEGRGNGLGNKILAYDLQAHGFDTYDADEALGFEQDGRRFDFAAAMLKVLGAQRVRLLTNNPEKIAAVSRSSPISASWGGATRITSAISPPSATRPAISSTSIALRARTAAPAPSPTLRRCDGAPANASAAKAY